MTAHPYSEQDTNQLYSQERDSIYHRVWHSGGSLHWGVFAECGKGGAGSQNDFIAAMNRLDNMVIKQLPCEQGKHILDAGCGNGFTTLRVAQQTGASIHAVDINPERIARAEQKIAQSADLQSVPQFRVASIQALPWPDEYFDAIYSQSVIYHVPDKWRVLSEFSRVLSPGGILVFDDLFRPVDKLSDMAKKYVYERLKFDTPFNFHGYQAALEKSGFNVLESVNLTPHLQESYEYLAAHTHAVAGGDMEISGLAHDFKMTAQAISQGELGWGFFVAKKL